MTYTLQKQAMDNLFQSWSKDYLIYGPTLIKNTGRFSDTDSVRYDKLTSIDQLEFDKKSDYSFKDIIFPISEMLFSYDATGTHIPEPKHQGALVFLRACDTHALTRLDQIFLENGKPDFYYKRLRENLKIVLLPCRTSFENCFCVSMKSNIPHQFDYALEVKDGAYILNTQASSLSALLKKEKTIDYTVPFVTSNTVVVEHAKKIDVAALTKSEMWREYDSRCINCGRCNLVCPTCTCWTMQDIHYSDNKSAGERRRIHASCMVDNFDRVAGNHVYRPKNGDRMRYKTLHKVYDHKLRFGVDLCVGCGRCDDICPEYISFSNILNKVAQESK